MLQDRPIAEFGLGSPHLMHNRLFEAGRFSVESIKTALEIHFNQEHSTVKRPEFNKCETTNQLCKLLGEYQKMRSKNLQSERVIDYLSIMKDATFIELNDYVVDCGFADSYNHIPVIIRKSGSISILYSTPEADSEMNAIDVIRTMQAIKNQPDVYLNLRTPENIKQYQDLGKFHDNLITKLRHHSRNIIELITKVSSIDRLDLDNITSYPELMNYLLLLLNCLSRRSEERRVGKEC